MGSLGSPGHVIRISATSVRLALRGVAGLTVTDIWFDSKLNFKSHVEKRLNSATSAYFGLQRLANTQKGLSFENVYRLYIAYISSIGDFGVQVW